MIGRHECRRSMRKFLEAEIKEDKKRVVAAEAEQQRPGLTTQQRANHRAVIIARERRIMYLRELITKLGA